MRFFGDMERKPQSSPATHSETTLPRMLLSEHEAAAALGLSSRTLFDARKAGRLECVRIGTRVLYTPVELQRFIDARRVVA